MPNTWFNYAYYLVDVPLPSKPTADISARNQHINLLLMGHGGPRIWWILVVTMVNLLSTQS